MSLRELSPQPLFVPYGILANLKYKSSYHHYCGFYSLNVLASIVDDTVVVGARQFRLSEETAIDWAFDGVDTIVTEKRLLYTTTYLNPYNLIHNINHERVGMILNGVATKDDDFCYAIQDGFNLFNEHLSGVNLVVREKTKPIAYADQQFDTKEELLEYLENGEKSKGRGAILYHRGGRDAQLVQYNDGLNYSNAHLRKKVFGVL